MDGVSAVGPRVMVEVKVVVPGRVMICVMMTSLLLTIGVVCGLGNVESIAILSLGCSLIDCSLRNRTDCI